jgi:hypothetical protein
MNKRGSACSQNELPVFSFRVSRRRKSFDADVDVGASMTSSGTCTVANDVPGKIHGGVRRGASRLFRAIYVSARFIECLT